MANRLLAITRRGGVGAARQLAPPFCPGAELKASACSCRCAFKHTLPRLSSKARRTAHHSRRNDKPSTTQQRTRAKLGYFVQAQRDCISYRRMPGFHTRAAWISLSRARGDWLPLHQQRYCRCGVHLFHCAPWENKMQFQCFTYPNEW